MWSSFRLVLSTDLPLFQLLTVFSRFPIRAAFQPLHQLIFHHQFAPAYPQGRKIRAAQKVVCPRLEICNASASCFASITSGMASNGSLLIKSPSRMKKQQLPFRYLQGLQDSVRRSAHRGHDLPGLRQIHADPGHSCG